MKQVAGDLSLDVVIPAYNEENVLDLLFEELGRAFSTDRLAANGVGSVRFVFVDDGSEDRTAEMIWQRLQAGLPGILCRLSRNFGHQSAVSAGLDLADADMVSVLDADLQDPPELIYRMIEKWRDGYDVVYGQRRRRKEGFVKLAGYWLFYRLLGMLSEIPMPLDTGDFCLMGRNVTEALKAMPEKLRFVRGLRAWVGFKQVGIEYDRAARKAGHPKYTMRKLYRLATDGIASSSVRPLRVAQVFSFAFFTVSFLMALAMFGCLFYHTQLISLQTAGICFLVAIGGAVQTFCLYIIGAYLGRMYMEVKGRPSYVVMEVCRSAESEGSRSQS